MAVPRLTVLVTGGAGFIGGHLVRRLHAEGRPVTVLDDLSSGDGTGIPRGVPVIRADVADPAVVQVIADLAPAAIVHAAAQVSVPASVADPERDRAVNVDGTGHVVDGARRAGARRVVFLSSGGAAYGETGGASEADPTRPESPYGEHKLAAEAIVAGGPGPAIARLANVYGPGQRSDQDGGVVAIFCEAILAGRPITIHGDGAQVRDLVHVHDVVDALVTLLDGDRPGLWNVGTGIGTSINALVAALERVLGPAAAVEHGPRRAGDVRTSVLRIERIRADLGWVPRIDLERGLAMLQPGSADPLGITGSG